MGKDMIVAGHACLDITPAFGDQTHRPLAELFQPGKLIQMNGVTVSGGGCVSNTGLGLAKLGARVRLMAKVGDDAFGEILQGIYTAAGAADGLLVCKGERTSYSVVIAAPGTDRIFLHDPGANDSFCGQDIPEEALQNASWFHIGYPPLMRQMYQSQNELALLMKRVQQAGVATSLDLAIVSPDSAAGRADWATILQNALPYVDVFTPSVEELCCMLDKALYQSWLDRADGADVTGILDLEQDIRPLAKRALAMGCGMVLLKCGAPGLYLCTGNAEKMQSLAGRMQRRTDNFCVEWQNLDRFEKSYQPRQILSGTGAGDTSIAAFLLALNRDCPPGECLQLATATGACCVEQYDALSGLQNFDDLQKRIADGWKKN